MSQAFSSDADRLASFAKGVDGIRRRTVERIGETDLQYIRRVDWFSRSCEAVGRGLIHFSIEPVTFLAGVFSLWIHKQLQTTEVGHTALHGAFNKIEGAGRFHSKKFRWQTPIDEASWNRGHNYRHHAHTNIAGKDPDIHFGSARLTEHSPFRPARERLLPVFLYFVLPHFTFFMNVHFSGLNDVWFGNGRKDRFDFIKDRSSESKKDAYKRAFRKYLPYYAKEYGFFPLLAGPFFWKVALGNWMSERMRDMYTATTIICGHTGEETNAYDEGTTPASKGQRYAMHVEATNNFEVSLPLSVLCGALDHQIEHHLFPAFPTTKLREIAPEVRELCESHGVEYRSDTWPRTIQSALRHIKSLNTAPTGVMISALAE